MQSFEKQVVIYPDFPKPGVSFYDISPLLSNPVTFKAMIESLYVKVQAYDVDAIVGIDARGFIYGAALALRCEKGFIMLRKPGKLPGVLREMHYALEYGQNTLTIQRGLIKPKQRILIVDDVLASGGTAKVAAQLIEAEGGDVAGLLFPLEITALNGRVLLPYAIESLIKI